MQKSKLIRHFLSLLPLVMALAVTLTGCLDLGAFEVGEEGGYEDYYDTFGEVSAYHQTGVWNYDIEDSLFNKKTIEDFEWESSDDEVKYEEYLYLVIPVTEDVNISEIALYTEGATSADLEVLLFVYPDGTPIPSSMFRYDDEPPTEEEDPEEDDDSPSYDDLTEDAAIAHTTVSVGPDGWSSFKIAIGSASIEEEGYPMHDGDRLVLRFENNTGYGKLKGYSKCSFRFTNLLVRAVE